MFEQALKSAKTLSANSRASLIARLNRVREISHAIGYGVGDAMDLPPGQIRQASPLRAVRSAQRRDTRLRYADLTKTQTVPHCPDTTGQLCDLLLYRKAPSFGSYICCLRHINLIVT